MVGLIPLFAVETLEPEMMARLPGFQRRMQWFLDNMPGFASRVDSSQSSPNGVRRLLSLVGPQATGAHPGLHARQGRISFAARHPRALQISRGASLYLRGRRHANIAWITSRANRSPACSAGIPIGAARSGFP